MDEGSMLTFPVLITIIHSFFFIVFIIGVYNTPDRINELTYSYDPSQRAGGKGDLYLDFIEETVVPFVKVPFNIPPFIHVILPSFSDPLNVY